MMKQYNFEDKRQRPLSLAGVWSSEILYGKTVFMRVRFENTTTLPTGCPVCEAKNGKKSCSGEVE